MGNLLNDKCRMPQGSPMSRTPGSQRRLSQSGEEPGSADAADSPRWSGPSMGSAPVTGRGRNRPGIQATAPPGPWAEWPLPTAKPDPEAGGKASGAWNPVPPCHGPDSVSAGRASERRYHPSSRQRRRGPSGESGEKQRSQPYGGPPQAEERGSTTAAAATVRPDDRLRPPSVALPLPAWVRPASVPPASFHPAAGRPGPRRDHDFLNLLQVGRERFSASRRRPPRDDSDRHLRQWKLLCQSPPRAVSGLPGIGA